MLQVQLGPDTDLAIGLNTYDKGEQLHGKSLRNYYYDDFDDVVKVDDDNVDEGGNIDIDDIDASCVLKELSISSGHI